MRVGLGWVGFKVGLSNASGLLPTVWDSSWRIIRRHAIAILIRHGSILIRRIVIGRYDDGNAWSGWLPRFSTPRGVIWMETWRILLPREILYAPGAISIHLDLWTYSPKIIPHVMVNHPTSFDSPGFGMRNGDSFHTESIEILKVLSNFFWRELFYFWNNTRNLWISYTILNLSNGRIWFLIFARLLISVRIKKFWLIC